MIEYANPDSRALQKALRKVRRLTYRADLPAEHVFEMLYLYHVLDKSKKEIIEKYRPPGVDNTIIHKLLSVKEGKDVARRHVVRRIFFEYLEEAEKESLYELEQDYLEGRENDW